ncbi:MAG: NAD(P)H-hydrate dehydratase [Luteolibacter sp.]
MPPPARPAAGSVNAAGMRAIEAATMADGCDEATLMEIAGTRLGHAIARYFPKPGTAVAWPGKGHNGGDALIALRVLRDVYGWQIRIRHSFAENSLAPLTRRQLDFHQDTAEFDAADPTRRHPLVLLDGLLGIGADGSPLRGAVAEAAAEMNDLRDHIGAITAAVDLPSGLDPDSGVFPENVVHADVTFTLGAVKSGLLFPHAANAVGAIALVAIPQLTAPPGPGPRLICPQHFHIAIAPRPFDFHKGMAGRVSILAGSENYLGAATLCSAGALAGGAGLVTLHIPRAQHAAASAKCAPEVIVQPFDTLDDLMPIDADAWVIGCGLGAGWGDALVDFIAKTDVTPAVLDADALNTLARHHATDRLRANHLITPHPGEFRRLAPDLAELPPLDAATAWTYRSPATLLLKGSRTVVATRGQQPSVNSTGHPGMATAGMGDVLAGICGALLAAKIPPIEAAAFAAWLSGRAAERAIHLDRESAETLRASHITTHLGGAFHDWHGMMR